MYRFYHVNAVQVLLLGLSALFCACNPPPPACHDLPLDEQLPAPTIHVSVGGVHKNIPDLLQDTFKNDLLIVLQGVQADTYAFKIDMKGMPPCGIKTTVPQAHFISLPGGMHTLEYWYEKNGRASVHQTLAFYVKERLTEKWWFLPALAACIVLILGSVVYFWSLYNVRQKLKMQQVRNQIAADLHDEVSSDLSSIAISMTTLERRLGKQVPALSEAIQEIKQTLQGTQSNLSDTVWAIRPEKDNGRELFVRMQKFAQAIFSSGNTALVFNNAIPAGKTFKISMEQRFNAFMIVKEAIHNISKHAQATRAEINIQPHQEGVCIEIRDNGIGFDPNAERDGNGVNNYYRRAKACFFDIQVESAPGKGTFIRMVVPEL